MKARLKNQPTFKGAWFKCPNARGNSNNGSSLSAGLAKLGLMNSGEDYGGEKRIGDCSLQCFTRLRGQEVGFSIVQLSHSIQPHSQLPINVR